jgi:hypothetical protein
MGNETAIAAMQKATDDNARLMTASMVAGTAIQGMAATAQTVNGANAAGTEVAKTVANDMRQSAKSS